jgi:hypothetical protein
MEDYPSYKIVPVYGDKVAKQRKHPTIAYERKLQARLITFTCCVCKETVTQWRFPSKTPLYCKPACQEAARREKTRKRVQALRERRRNQKERQVIAM